MFEYVKEKRRMTMKLGNYISHEIVCERWDVGQSRIRTPEELNVIDRYELAREFIKNTEEYYDFYEDVDKDVLIKDMALYIDKRIPQAYEKHITGNHDCSGCKLNTDASKYGLIYKIHNEEDYDYDRLNFPYRRFSDSILYDMVRRDCDNAGFVLKKSFQDFTRVELLMLLNFFYKDIEFESLFDFVEYA